MKQLFSLLLALLASPLLSSAQLNTLVDANCYSTHQVFHSRKVERYNLWQSFSNPCQLPENHSKGYHKKWEKQFGSAPHYSQANLLRLHKNGIQLSNQSLSAVERKLISEHFPAWKIPDMDDFFACSHGVRMRANDMLQTNVDYFSLIIEQFFFLQDELQYDYITGGQTLSCRIIRTEADLDAVLADPNLLGITLSVQGAHNLGNYLFYEQEQTATSEYRNIIMNNIDRLKQAVPLRVKTNEYLDIPVLWFGIASQYEDHGWGGFEEGEGLTQLGKDGIERLLYEKKENQIAVGKYSIDGRRILIDIGNLTPEARRDFYTIRSNHFTSKDTFPIIATNVGISGLSQDNELYGKKPTKKDKPTFLKHSTQNLAQEDIVEIVNSQGLIGITTQADKLMGPAAYTGFEGITEGSREAHEQSAKIIAANLLAVVKAVDSKEAWDVLSIGSGMGQGGIAPLKNIEDAGKLGDLSDNLLAFFTNPKTIEGTGFTAKEIERLCFGLSPEEIVQKVMGENALAFIRRVL